MMARIRWTGGRNAHRIVQASMHIKGEKKAEESTGLPVAVSTEEWPSLCGQGHAV